MATLVFGQTGQYSGVVYDSDGRRLTGVTVAFTEITGIKPPANSRSRQMYSSPVHGLDPTVMSPGAI
jgi:hypothetical protein